MIGKVITNLYKWHITKQQLKQRDKKIDNELVAKKDMIMKLRGLYEFANWLNTKGIVGNRKQRKIFWKAVEEGKPVIQEVLQQLIQRHTDQIKRLEVAKSPVVKAPVKAEIPVEKPKKEVKDAEKSE